MPSLTPRELALARWSRMSPAARHKFGKRLNRKRNRVLSAGRRKAIARIAGLARAEQRKRETINQETELKPMRKSITVDGVKYAVGDHVWWKNTYGQQFRGRSL